MVRYTSLSLPKVINCTSYHYRNSFTSRQNFKETQQENNKDIEPM